MIVNYNGADYLGPCIEALERATLPPAEIVVVDNASTDDSLAELVAYPRVDVRPQPRNLGFAGGANVGLSAVETEFALLMNPDVEIEPDFGHALLAAFERDRRLGAAGALLFYPDGKTVQHAGGMLTFPQVWSSHRGQGQELTPALEREADVDYVAGGAMGLRIAALRAVGGFDERFYPAFFEDADLCVRLRAAGWRVRYFPSLRGIHHEGVTLGDSPLRYHYAQANRVRFALKHLSSVQWRRDFVPAEVARIRHALAEAAGEHWPEQSGLSGTEAVLRNPDAPEAGLPVTALHAALLPGVREALEAARVAAAIPEPLPDPPGPAARLRMRFADGREMQRIAEALLRQHEFNRAVVAALEAQDKLNREQLALVLTLALDLLQYLPITHPPGSAPMPPPGEIPDGS